MPATPEIDMVYLWVDGNDPQWIEKKIKCTGALNNNTDVDCKGRYIDNEELRYSLRSIEKYAPWIRKIFIVTDNQKPDWLDLSHPKINIIDHKDILPAEALPCFNAIVIEHYLYKIPDLSEYFLFSNDDMFLNKSVSPNDFFDENANPIVRLKKKPLGRLHLTFKKLTGKQLGHYRQMLEDAANIIDKRYGKYIPHVPHHNIDSYRKSVYKNAVENTFKELIEAGRTNHTRKPGDTNRVIFSYYALVKGQATIKYTNRNESSRLLPYKHDFGRYMKKYNPIFFCINDDQKVSDEQRQKIKPFLESVFPEKSAFEK